MWGPTALLLVAAWPGLTSAKSGRRSDSFHSKEEEEVVRRELTYSQPPRSRGAQEPEPESSFHFVPTAPSVTSRREPNQHKHPEDLERPNKNVTAADQETLVAEICRFSQHSLCNLFRPKTAKVGEMGAGLKADLAELASYSNLDPDQSMRQPTPEPTTEEERLRFQYRHNYPYRRQDGRRQMLKGDFGVRDERRTRPTTTTTSTTTTPPPPPPSSTAEPLHVAGPFVTVDRELGSENARQPKDYDYGAGSRLNEVRVLPPKEFRHLLAQVDGVAESQDDTVASEQRLRPSSRRNSKKFRGVPGTAGRDFPTLGSIPMTSFSCIGTKAGFYADLEANCQVYHYCHFDGRQDSFLCANGTVFNQKVFTCDWWYNVNCASSENLYDLNDNLYKDESSMFAESKGGSGNDFDLSKLQKLLKINTMEIDNLLSPSKDSFVTLLEDTALPVSLIRSSSGKSLGEHEVKGASAPLEKEDISVSYETRPKGGFSVFYTVPKEPVEASKMSKLKRLIEQANENYSEYEGDYYEEGEYEGNDIDSYEVEAYYDDEDELLTEPPDIADDYYDPGPPDSYYDDAAEDSFDDYDDYEDDYYYDAAEDRMLVESSTPTPVAVLSPTVQKLNEISQVKEMLLRRMKEIKHRTKKKKKKKPRKNKKVDLQGQMERTPVEPLDDFIVVEDVTTKRTFNPSTHRSIRINPTTAIIDHSKEGANPDGFLGLFATVDSKAAEVTSTTPKYLGTLDLDDLEQFKKFQRRSNGDPQQLKAFLTQLSSNKGFSKRMSRGHEETGMAKRKSSRKEKKRVSPPYEDPDKKIEALQVLVTSNIQNSLAERRRQYLAQKSTPRPSPGRIHQIHTQEQVEKPPEYNAGPRLPFLVQDSLPFLPANQQQSQQFNFVPSNNNGGQNFVLLPTASPPMYGPTLPAATYSFTAADSKTFHGGQNLPLSSIFSGGEVSRQLAEARQEQAELQKRLDQFLATPHQGFVQPNVNVGQNNFVTPNINIGQSHNSFVTPSFNPVQYQSSFVTPRPNIDQGYSNFIEPYSRPNSYSQPGSENIPSSIFNSRGDYPRALNFGLPMNFEDMMNTGLSLAKQSQMYRSDNSQRRLPSLLSTLAPVTPAPTKAPMQSWNLQQTDHKTVDENQKSKSKERFKDFRPSKSAKKAAEEKLHGYKKPSINTVDSDQIHIIGPNCYVMTDSGFKLVGAAELCREEKASVRRRTGPSSIWDSLTSLPIVNTFAKTLGMRQ